MGAASTAGRRRARVPIDAPVASDAAPWTPHQQWLVLLTALTIIFDGFDNQLLGLALPAIMQDWELPRSAFAPVVSMGYLGMMIGGAVAGRAGDRFGRRTALLGSVAAFGAATATISLVDGLTPLAAFRFLAGVGLGGAIPNAASLAAEYVPLQQRPLAVTLTIVSVPIGGVVAGLFAILALPSLGWRGMFAIGGVIPIILVIALTRLLPESPHFLASDRVRKGSFTTLLTREFRVDTLALWVAFLSCLLAVYLGFSWLPSLLTGAGLGAAVASTGLTLFNLGGVVGAIAGGACIARFGSKTTMLSMAAGAVLGSLVMSRMTLSGESSPLPFLVMLTITGGLINAVQTTMYALAAHVYPTMIRATGVGTASAIGRTGAILSGYAGPWALEQGEAPWFFGLMAGSLLVTFLALAVVRGHVASRPGSARRDRAPGVADTEPPTPHIPRPSA
jgi:MFS transporter, AAHS family, 4-hydroxybenzoate transporter